MTTLEEHFSDRTDSRMIFDALRAAMEDLGPVELRITKSQVAFRRRIAFAWAWIPGRYLRGKRPPLVLTVALRRRHPSKRWKQVVEPATGRFVHHLELSSAGEVDDEVRTWLREAWSQAG